MKVIAISGIIGWDVKAKDIRAELDEAKGEDVEVQVSSPGGFVYEGLEIFNLIRNYEGSKTTRLMGLAASMASYIIMAGDKVIAEDNAVFMLHNAVALAIGDHNVLRKAGDIVEGLSKIIGKSYVEKTGKTRAEIEKLMDDETFYFGQEILDEGFVDEIAEASDSDKEDDKAASIAEARAQIFKCEKQVRETENPNDLFKVAAMLRGSSSDPGCRGTGVTGGYSAREAKNMTPEQLKAKSPDLYNAGLEGGHKEGEAAGIKQERERILSLSTWTSGGGKNKRLDSIIAAAVKDAIASGAGNEAVIARIKQERERVFALAKWKGIDEGNQPLNAIVDEAIATGKTEKEVYAQLSVAVQKFVKGGSEGVGGIDVDVQKVLDRLAKKLGPARAQFDHIKLNSKDEAFVKRTLAKWDDVQLNKIIGQHGNEDYRHVFED